VKTSNLSSHSSGLNYNSFGMSLSERTFESATGYRYGFNGKEHDDEISGNNNELDLGARIYNSRIGRFLSIDPMANSYPWQSPYAYYSNNYILVLDVNGMGDGWLKNDDPGEYLWDENVSSAGDKDMPENYTYVGENDKDIAVDLFGNTSYSASTLDFGIISFDDCHNPYQSRGVAAKQTAVTTTMNVNFSAKVSYVGNSRIFYGINLNVSITGTSGIPKSGDDVPQVILEPIKKTMNINGPEMVGFDNNLPHFSTPSEIGSLSFSTSWSANIIYENYEKTIPLNFEYSGLYITNTGWIMSQPTALGLTGLQRQINTGITVEFANYANCPGE